MCNETGCAAATARKRVASPLTVVTTPALSSVWADARSGRLQISAAAVAARIFAPDISVSLPLAGLG
jgi:hypothetical protein